MALVSQPPGYQSETIVVVSSLLYNSQSIKLMKIQISILKDSKRFTWLKILLKSGVFDLKRYPSIYLKRVELSHLPSMFLQLKSATYF